MTELNTLFQLFNNLSESEKKAFLRKIKGENSTTQSKFRTTCNCAYCKSQHIVKFGKSDKGEQRYLCKDCNKTFTAKTNTILYKSPYSEKVWRKYINCMMQGMSIRKSAKECGINADTAFKWRHKILDSLQSMHDEVKLDGVVEADETFFALSFKGNHKKSNFNLPRESHHRGKCTHTRGISSEQFCNAFYQKLPFYAVSHGRVNILLPKFELTSNIALFICTLIKHEQYRFSYGRAVYSSVCEKIKIKLPALLNSQTNEYEPDWQFMETYIKNLPYGNRI